LGALSPGLHRCRGWRIGRCGSANLAATRGLRTRRGLRRTAGPAFPEIRVRRDRRAGVDRARVPLRRSLVLLKENLMRTLLAIGSSMRTLVAAGSLATLVSPVWAGPKTVSLSVPTMDCPVCPITVKQALTKVPGVTRADVSFEKRQATVTFDDAKTN